MDPHFETTLYLRLVDQENSELSNKYQDIKEKQFTSASQHADSGVDIFTPQKIICKSGETTTIPLGIYGAVYSSNEIPMPYYVYPRSSISNTPLRLANSVGIIDCGFRGELLAKVDNISKEDYIVDKYQRLFQICSGNLMPFTNLKLIKTLDVTQRGSCGFGSTGM
jgi:dUTP pyrophosphatase